MLRKKETKDRRDRRSKSAQNDQVQKFFMLVRVEPMGTRWHYALPRTSTAYQTVVFEFEFRRHHFGSKAVFLEFHAYKRHFSRKKTQEDPKGTLRNPKRDP